MRADLDRNYAEAVADASRRGVSAKLTELEAILRKSVATINISPKLLYNIAAGQNYMNYFKAFSSGLRRIAERQYHAQREKVDGVIHPGYREEILNAALSTCARGLTSYGPITLQLSEISICDRSSVMRENSFDFFERNQLGQRNAEEEPGWRSTWEDRTKLGVAQLASSITAATGRDDFPALLISSGTTRTEDHYMEVHIFGELNRQDLKIVSLSRPLTEPGEQDDWEFAKQKLEQRGVTFIDWSST